MSVTRRSAFALGRTPTPWPERPRGDIDASQQRCVGVRPRAKADLRKSVQDDVRGALQIVQAKAGAARLSGNLLRQRRHMDEAHGQWPASTLQGVADAVEQV